jgi:uncharacterized protein (DUF58 family)
VAQRRRVRFRAEGWYYLLVLALVAGSAIFRVSNPLLMLSGLMIAPLLLNWRMAVAAMQRLTVRRRLPRRICAGDPLVVDVEVANGKRSLDTRALAVRDQIQLEGGSRRFGAAVEMLLTAVPAQESRSVSYHAELSRRGCYRFGPLDACTSFPFGLLQVSMRVKQFDTVLVCPRLGRLTGRWRELIESRRDGGQPARQRRGPPDGDYFGLREFQAGDSMRWIHWRTSAKLGKLAVRLLERQRNYDVALLLDLWQPAEPCRDDLDRVELAVSFAATVAADLCRRGDNRLLVAGADIAGSPRLMAASPLLLDELLEQLAIVRGAPDDKFPSLLAELSGAIPPGTHRLVVSTRPAPPEASREPLTTWLDVSDEGRLARLFEID